MSGWTLCSLTLSLLRAGGFFDCSTTDYGFLSLPVEEWRTDDQCLEAEKFVNTLKCTIDVAERGNTIIRMMMMMIIQIADLQVSS